MLNPTHGLIVLFFGYFKLNFCGAPFSAFVESLVPRGEILLENVNMSSKSKGVQSMLSDCESDIEADHETMEMNSGTTSTNTRYYFDFISFFTTSWQLLSTTTRWRRQSTGVSIPDVWLTYVIPIKPIAIETRQYFM